MCANTVPENGMQITKITQVFLAQKSVGGRNFIWVDVYANPTEVELTPNEAEMASFLINAFPTVLKEFLCRKCKTPARVKEGAPDEWACSVCCYTTKRLAVDFARVDK